MKKSSVLFLAFAAMIVCSQKGAAGPANPGNNGHPAVVARVIRSKNSNESPNGGRSISGRAVFSKFRSPGSARISAPGENPSTLYLKSGDQD